MTPRYVVAIYGRCGTERARRESPYIHEALAGARELAKQYPMKDYAIVYENVENADVDFDGLTDEERELFEDAIEIARVTGMNAYRVMVRGEEVFRGPRDRCERFIRYGVEESTVYHGNHLTSEFTMEPIEARP